MDREINDLKMMQEEVIKKFGGKYLDITLIDWRHIIESYMPMIYANMKDVVLVEKAQTISLNYSHMPQIYQSLKKIEKMEKGQRQ